MNDYPTVRLLLRWGNHMAIAAALAMPAFTLLLIADGWPWTTLLAGLFAGAAVLILARSYVELNSHHCRYPVAALTAPRRVNPSGSVSRRLRYKLCG